MAPLDFGPFLFLATLEGLLQASILALTALGLSLVFGVMRIVNVAHGEFFMLGAVCAWLITSLLPLHPAFAFLLALIFSPLATALVAFACERLFLSRLVNNAEATIVATIGMLYMIQQSVLLTYGPDARPVEGPFYFRVEFPWFGYSGYNLFVIAAVVVILLVVWFVLSKTRLGLIMRATQYDRETAQAFGIPVRKVYAITFAVGAGLAALAAVLIVPVRQAHYLMGQDALLLSFIVVIIGGLGSLSGTVAAALLIGLGDGIISVFFSPTLAKMISTLLVAMVLIVKPEGLFGARAR